MKTKVLRMLTAALAVSIITVFVAGCDLGGVSQPGIRDMTFSSGMLNQGRTIPLSVDIRGINLNERLGLSWEISGDAGVSLVSPQIRPPPEPCRTHATPLILTTNLQ